MKTQTIQHLLDETRHPDAKRRRSALLELCPCRVRSNHTEIWDRLIDMHADADSGVRSIILHNLCDGSPREREEQVIAAIETLAQDEDRKLRRRARNVLSVYRRTGIVNIE